MKPALILLIVFTASLRALLPPVDTSPLSPALRIPKPVKEAMSRIYPGHVKWEKEQMHYEASYVQNGRHTSLVFDDQGRVLETEIRIRPSALPVSVRSYLNWHFPGKKIREAAEITEASGRRRYEAEINGKDILLNEKGERLN